MDFSLFFPPHRPGPVSTTLGSTKSVAVLDISKLTRSYPVTGLPTVMIPEVKLKRPEMGETRYFCLHNCTQVAIGGSKIENASCGGRFCDRQTAPTGPRLVHAACGCFYDKDMCRYVTEHFVRIPASSEFSADGHATINNFRSHKFDQLVFSRDCLSVLEMGNVLHNKVVREHISATVKYVNEHSGWTVIGWVRTGAVLDVSDEGSKDRDVENIASFDQRPHISFMTPTNIPDWDNQRNKRRLNLQRFRHRLQQLERMQNGSPPSDEGSNAGGNNHSP